MDTEADYYFAAGDLVNWARGLEPCGKIMEPRGEKVLRSPRKPRVGFADRRILRAIRFPQFHEQSIRIGKHHVAGLGYSSSHAIRHSRRIQRSRNWRSALGGVSNPSAHWCLICHAPPHRGNGARLGTRGVFGAGRGLAFLPHRPGQGGEPPGAFRGSRRGGDFIPGPPRISVFFPPPRGRGGGTLF